MSSYSGESICCEAMTIWSEILDICCDDLYIFKVNCSKILDICYDDFFAEMLHMCRGFGRML